MEKDKKAFGERLGKAMAAAGYEAKAAVLAREFNQRYIGKAVTLHGVRRWLLGETIPGEDKLLVLGRWLKVEPQHLVWGDEPKKIAREKKTWAEAIDFREKEIFEAFLALTASQKKIIREVVMAFAQLNAR
jgi:hypothetical protein